MPTYTVRDSQTGKTVTFNWYGQGPPTDADMAEVFQSAGSFQPPQQSGGLIQSILGGLTGVLKSAGSTASNVMQAGGLDSILGPAASMLTKDNPYNVALQPEGTAEKVGFGAGEIGQFFLPGGVTSKVGTGLVGKMGLEALSAGGVSAAQGENPLLAAALGAAGPGLGKLLGKAAPKLEAGAEKSMTQALSPTTTVMKGKAEKVVPGLLERGVSGSRPSMLARAEEGLAATGPKYDAVVKSQGKTAVDTKAVVDSLEQMKSRFMVSQKSGGQAAATKGAEANVKLIEDLQQRVANTEPTLESVRALRSILGSETEKAFGKLPKEQQAAERIKDETYKALRRELQKSSPDLAVIDKEFSFWSNVKDVLVATEKRTKPQEGGLLSGLAAKGAAGAGLLGAATGSVETVASAAAFAALSKVVASPGWKSWSAVQRHQLARALAAGRFDQALAVIGRGVAGASTASQSNGR